MGVIAGVTMAALILAGVNVACTGIAALLIKAALGSSNLDSIYKLLSFSQGVDIFGNYWNAINTAFNVIKPFGIALITTYFILHMYDIATKDQLTIDSLIKSMIGLVLAIGIFGNMYTIVNTTISVGDTMLSKLQTELTGTGSFDGDWKLNDKSITEMEGDEIFKELNGNAWGVFTGSADTGVGLMLQALVIWLIHQIAVIAIDLAAISRIIEIGWRTILSPIGCANAFDGGANAPAIKYLKTLAGVILSGPAMYIIAVIGYNIAYGIFAYNKEGIGMFASAAAVLATAGASIGIGNKVKEVVS